MTGGRGGWGVGRGGAAGLMESFIVTVAPHFPPNNLHVKLNSAFSPLNLALIKQCSVKGTFIDQMSAQAKQSVPGY